MPSDPLASDGDHGGGSDTQTTQEAPLTAPDEGENDSTTAGTQIHELHKRLREMESKMGSVDKLYNLHKSTAEAMEFSTEDPTISAWSNPAFDPIVRRREELEFYTDVLFFMRKLRHTHKAIVERERINKERMEALQKPDDTTVDDRIEKICLDAFKEGKRLKLIQMEWDDYLLRGAYDSPIPIEENCLTPVHVISGEPDSRLILQFPTAMRSIESAIKDRAQVERISPTFESGNLFEQEPLPERIRIHSRSLVAIFHEIAHMKGPPRVPMVNIPQIPTVYLRPFQDILYIQQDLRDWLAMLEKHFEKCDETRHFASASNSSSPAKPHDDPVSSDKDETKESLTYRLSHSVSALLHLRCLMEFIDKEIKPKQEYINSPECTRIHFHDLWHLFKPGDEVIQQDGKQAFVVLRVQVPKHRVEEPWNRWNKADDSSDSSSSSSDSDDDDDGDDGDDGTDGPFRVHCAYIDFDGKYFGPVSKRFKIPPFGETKSIRSLPLYPLRHTKDAQARQALIKRGQMLLEVSKFKAMYYMGVTIDKRDEIDSQVVIDFNEALADEERRKAWEPRMGNLRTAADHLGRQCTAHCCFPRDVRGGSQAESSRTEDHIKSLLPHTLMGVTSLILQSRSLQEVLSSLDKLTETEYTIMTYRVFGFILRSRKWAQLDLNLLRYENANARNLTVDAFEGLELPDNHREVLKSLVVQHFRSKQSTFMKNEQTDLIQGKGKGLILLLHGAPGVGKTTTAEGIAELFKKPLFQITCGDLGTTAREVETELEKNFSLASRWGCILLLDEADVFLSAREKMDFKRNGLVAVFLRVLEYYSGILFLTTNRIGDFDEAFSSRIHMSLYYPPLDEDKTLKVFQLNLDLIKKRFVRQGRSITFDASAVEKFARDHFKAYKYNRWNGRQIRNACQTALALAEFDSQGGTMNIESEMDKSVVVELQQKYFETVQKAYLAFDEYLGDIQGTQGDSRAIDYKLRARTDTPYQAKRNAFPQHESYRVPRSQHILHPEYPHTQRGSANVSQSNFGPQGDPFDQNYTPTTPNANMQSSRGYEHYSPHRVPMQSYQGQARGGSMTSREAYERSPEASQQYQTDHQYAQGGPRGQQFDSPRGSNRIIRSVEDERYSSPGYDDSPLPNRPAQRPSQAYSYENPNDGGSGQNLNPSMQGPSSYNPNTIFRSRRDDGGS
ncbi:hypothetical protein PFICI_02763 [Pestalotiopsis fici W106-1]|uniref:AAA+ ATPase domain-containing protein n=1 Tax=Pestalotiopsis fici (strain W106-1 / CGMCC3.15140) TaxID=1229662 RepID=W3XF85_PESFW|nr:uncharacterized protein PFICI_02763 [Pestalotiopsis fici W106-1]ETS84738.1 hypothetical protein PFICI_02763 [Pestalotiopsis fici W106-1]